MCVCVCVQLIDSLLWKEREKSEWKREEDLDAFFFLPLSSTIVKGSEPYCGAPTVTSCHSILVGKRQGVWRGAGVGQSPDNASLALQFRSFSPTRHSTGRARLFSCVLVKWSVIGGHVLQRCELPPGRRVREDGVSSHALLHLPGSNRWKIQANKVRAWQPWPVFICPDLLHGMNVICAFVPMKKYSTWNKRQLFSLLMSGQGESHREKRWHLGLFIQQQQQNGILSPSKTHRHDFQSRQKVSIGWLFRKQCGRDTEKGTKRSHEHEGWFGLGPEQDATDTTSKKNRFVYTLGWLL